MNLMKLNPTPIAWSETLDGLKQGLIDGAETWASAVAYANMSPVVSQCVNLEFFCGTEHTAMSSKVFDKVGGKLQDDIMESAYLYAGPCSGCARSLAGQYLRLLQSAASQHNFCQERHARRLDVRGGEEGSGGDVFSRSIIRRNGSNGASGSTAGPAEWTPTSSSPRSPAKSRRTRWRRMSSRRRWWKG